MGKKQKQRSLDELKKEVKTTDHIMSADDLAKKYNSNVTTGLTTSVVDQHQNQYGKNQLTPAAKTPAWLRFAKNLFGGFAMLLWTGSVLCFIAYGIEKGQDPENTNQDNVSLAIIISFESMKIRLF